MALKIPDYFASVRPLENRISGRHGTAPVADGAFIRLLTPGGDVEPVEASGCTGLTIADYLARPVACPVVRLKSPVADSQTEAPLTAPAEVVDAGPVLPQEIGAGEDPGKIDTETRQVEGVAVTAPVDDPQDIIDRCVAGASRKYRLPEGLLRAVIRAESNFDPQAVSPAGARGLMQLMPATAKELGVVDSFDIEQNIDGGASYLRQMLDRFGGSLKSALAAYNAGPGTVERYRGRVPYAETVRYVARVMADARRAA
ncbi:MAG: lytic transglycosylase domain-containing protein [Desulfobacterales bacterium]|nr:lytic transglycosylase domain-containing protein [Desulfobacterales bacterium]